MHPGQRMRPGRRVRFERGGRTLHGEVLEERYFGRRLVRFWTERRRHGDGRHRGDRAHPAAALHQAAGPRRCDRDRYQTVFAREAGSIAAPTAGLHFTEAILRSIDDAGVERTAITLHVGYGTFKPVRVAEVEAHTVDPERYAIGEDAASRINAALEAGPARRGGRAPRRPARWRRRRSGAAGASPRAARETGLFIHPGHRFLVAGGLVTNFHLPGLVAADARRGIRRARARCSTPTARRCASATGSTATATRCSWCDHGSLGPRHRSDHRDGLRRAPVVVRPELLARLPQRAPLLHAATRRARPVDARGLRTVAAALDWRAHRRPSRSS